MADEKQNKFYNAIIRGEQEERQMSDSVRDYFRVAETMVNNADLDLIGGNYKRAATEMRQAARDLLLAAEHADRAHMAQLREKEGAAV